MRSPFSLSTFLKRHRLANRSAMAVTGFGFLAVAGMTAKNFAAAIAWDGDTSINFTADGNWTGGTAPVNNLTSDIAVFGDPAGITFQPTLDASRSVQGLSFTAGGWTLGSGGAFTLSLGAGGITTAGSGTTTINAAVTQSTSGATWNLGTGHTLVLNGQTTLTSQPLITGAGNLVKGSTAIGAGTTTTVSGNNTYTGTTTIRQGTLALTSNVLAGQNGALGNSTSALIMGDSGTLDAAASSPQNTANVILLFDGAGATLFSRNIDATGATAGGRNRIAVSGNGAANVEVSGNIVYSTNPPSNVRRFEVGAANGKTLTFSGLISSTANSTGILINGSNYGTGTIRLTNAANSFTGGVTVVNGFLSVSVGVSGSGNSAIGTGGLVIGEGATPSTGAGGVGLTTAIGFLMETGGTSFGRSITLARGATYATTPTSHNGVVNAYVVGGTNTSGTVTYSGNINSAAVDGNNIANGDVNLNLRSTAGGTVSFTGVINENTDANYKTFVNINQVTNLAANNVGPGTTNGPVYGGTVILTNANTYQGGTYVRGGTALANNTTGSAMGTGAVNVLGGTFGGTGGVTGAVVVSSGAKLAPGAGGIESLGTGSLTMDAGAIFSLEINTTTSTVDLLAVNGDVTLSLAGNAILDVTDLGSLTLSPNTALTFLTYTGTYNGGLFSVNGVPIADDTGTFVVGQNAFHIDYNHGGTGGGNSVALVATVVPEPGSVGLAVGGLGMLLGLRRRRKS